MKPTMIYLKTALAVTLALPNAVLAQQPKLLRVLIVDGGSVKTSDTRDPDSTNNSNVPSSASLAPKPVQEVALTARWLDLTTLSHSQRYRNQYGNDGYHYFEDG